MNKAAVFLLIAGTGVAAYVVSRRVRPSGPAVQSRIPVTYASNRYRTPFPYDVISVDDDRPDSRSSRPPYIIDEGGLYLPTPNPDDVVSV